jgi:1-acyl-sn-glycerol-3-phosphate acyltransferase
VTGVARGKLPWAYRFVASWLQPLLWVLTKRDWHGIEHLPRDRGFVAVPNHISYYDPMVTALFLYHSGTPPFYLGKEAVFRIPVLGRLIRAAGQIPVYRGSGLAAQAYRDALTAVRAGRAVVVYPEGTLTRDPDLWPMRGKTGAARIALETRCPVIPVAQWGAQEVIGNYQKGLHLLPRKTMHVLAGPPVELSDLFDRPIDAALLREATDRIMAALTANLEVLRGQSAPPVRFDPRAQGIAETGNFRKDHPPDSQETA